jgi:WD40 repeat protein
VLSCDWCGVEDLIATSSEDGTVKIWASNTGKKIITLRGHTSKVYRAKFNGHGDYLASASCDGTMRLWNPHRAYQSTVKKVHSDFIYDLALSTGDGGKFAATVSNDGSWAWNDIRTQEVLRLTTKAHPTAIWGAGISHDNRIVATASLDSTIRLWEVASGNEVAQLSGHTQAVQRVMFVDPSGSGGSESILSCSRDRTVGLWDVGMRSMVMNLQTQHDMGVCGIAEYQGLMLTASTDKTVRVWKYSS